MLKEKPKLKAPRQKQGDSTSVKLDFASWKSQLDELVKLYSLSSGKDCKAMRTVSHGHLGVIEQIRLNIQRDIKEFHPILAYQLSSQTMCKAQSAVSLDETIQLLTTLKLNSNEFYTIFDTSEKEHVAVDSRISDILGIDPSNFNMKSMLGLDPDNPLFHPDDIYHSIRFGTIAYFVLAIPSFEFKALEDFYSARFRISTSSSKIDEVRNAQYVILEKKSYLTEEREKDSPLAMRILYRWSVYFQEDYDHRLPYFATDPIRTSYMLDFWYLYNAHLIGISPKFILMLDARNRHDRNKAIATEFNQQIKFFNESVKSLIDEGQIADCFSKTIRPKVAEAINIWEKRSKPLVIHSDIEAVQYAKRLGLLPIPKRIKEIMYKNITQT